MNGINQNSVYPCTLNFDISSISKCIFVNIYNVNGSRARTNEPKNEKMILDQTSNFE